MTWNASSFLLLCLSIWTWSSANWNPKGGMELSWGREKGKKNSSARAINRAPIYFDWKLEQTNDFWLSTKCIFLQNFFSNETTWKFISSNALVSVKKGRQQNMHFATFFPSLLEFSSRNAFYEPRLDTKQAETVRIPWENSLADEIFWKLITLD